MRTTAEIQVDPLSSGISIRRYIATAVDLLDRAKFTTRVHALGTQVEGELQDVLAAVFEIHRSLHDEGAVRLVTTLRVHTRKDGGPSPQLCATCDDEPQWS